MFKIGDRVHDKKYYKGIGNGVITSIETVRNPSTGVTYTACDVEYDEPVCGPWPRYRTIRRATRCEDALELL